MSGKILMNAWDWAAVAAFFHHFFDGFQMAGGAGDAVDDVFGFRMRMAMFTHDCFLHIPPWGI